MKIIISKADKIGDKDVRDVEIHIKKGIPHFNNLAEAREYYRNDAEDIYEALKMSLPQGTLHQLLLLLLKDKIELYRGDMKMNNKNYIKEITIEEAEKIIKEYGIDEDLYIARNLKQFMNNGEPDDNSIQLSKYFRGCLKKIVARGLEITDKEKKLKDIEKIIDKLLVYSERHKSTETSDKHETEQLNILGVSKRISCYVAKNKDEIDVENMLLYKTKSKAVKEWGKEQEIVKATIVF